MEPGGCRSEQVKNQFRIDYDCSIEDFLESVYMAGADLGGTDIENHARCIERSYKMLTLLENSVNLLRTRHQSGGRCLRLDTCTTRFSIPAEAEKCGGDHRSAPGLAYQGHQLPAPTTACAKRPWTALSSVLWGFSAQDTLKTLDLLFPAGCVRVFWVENWEEIGRVLLLNAKFAVC